MLLSVSTKSSFIIAYNVCRLLLADIKAEKVENIRCLAVLIRCLAGVLFYLMPEVSIKNPKISCFFKQFTRIFITSKYILCSENEQPHFEFFCLQRFPLSISLKSSLVISGVKRYIGTFDVISELYCILLRRRRRFKNRSFS